MQTNYVNHLLRNSGKFNATVQDEVKSQHSKSTLSSFFLTHTESTKAIRYDHNVDFRNEKINSTDNNYNVLRNASRRGERSLQTLFNPIKQNLHVFFILTGTVFFKQKKNCQNRNLFTCSILT